MLSSRVLNWGTRVLRRGFASDAKAEVTALYDFHVENGGKMVNFGGFMLPVQYSDLGIAASHLHTRKNASLFDVSHMLQTEISGSDCLAYMESLCTADLKTLPPNTSTLTVFTNEKGGVLDDLIITKISDDHLYVVSNAAMKKQDQQHLLKALDNHKKSNPNSNIKMKFFEPSERGLVALQGPKAAEVLQKMIDVDLSKLYFMTSTEATVCGCGACRVTRCGYTGEDGFEISMPAIKQVDITREIMKDGAVKLAGLGARDSLRLEAGMCLYGNDLTSETTPIEAALTWLVAKRRRESRDFPGAETIVSQIKNGASRKRVGLIADGGPPARHGTPIVDSNGNEIGSVTSGCPSPSLGKNIAMAYVPTDLSKNGTKHNLKIRDKIYSAVVTKMPFVPSNYYNKPK
ncbi:aminomethyltransferase, mitochondrial [Tribolium madens]|uniref:aminomethyltransferase, mitochondrial n=1 Tax=Tribolium madens TaxID=41895 RepID=UPI001CF74676|nr:aminomethyltransferase, mitochondrial [Tribolium madens]XP_044260538.1 aminomethyltransferase, mitochondrial [Tribolium madens]